MTVHLQISKQINNHIQAQTTYKELDLQREKAIEEVLNKARNNEEFTTHEVNSVTEELNEIAKKYNFPIRKRVTNSMVLQYVAKENTKN